MTLRVEATVEARDVSLDVTVEPGETLAVLGPNGAGKSTLLQLVAGLLAPTSGTVTLDGEVLADSTTSRAPHRRGVAMLAQDPLLFPHLSVLDNVAFGPRSAGASRRGSRAVADRWLTEVDAADLAGRRPAALSGGQAQRVAVARALATDPRVLLLDEPMAALDVTAVPAVRSLLRRVLADRTTLLVTHDVLDALLLADRVVVVEDGRVAEQGPTRDVLSRPRSTFGAVVAGLNLVRGTARDGGVDADGLRMEGVGDPLPDGTPAVAVFDPSAVAVHLARPGGSPRNVHETVVTELEPHGSQVRVRTPAMSADVTTAAVAELGLAPETPVFLAVKASEVRLHPA